MEATAGAKARRLCSQKEAQCLGQSEGGTEQGVEGGPVLGWLACRGRVLRSRQKGSHWRIHWRVSISYLVSQASRNIQKVI